ncbi:unnamed protein product [Urochloa humidicola]
MEVTAESTDPTPPPAPLQEASPAAVSSVLGDDDLFSEILLRLGFPTYLVHAALVSKHWLRRASDPAFLRRFRELHPPRPLGLYVLTVRPALRLTQLPQPPEPFQSLRFVPMPQAPDLAAVMRRGRFEVGHEGKDVSDSRNGRLAVVNNESAGRFTLFSPLHPVKGTIALPQLQTDAFAYRFFVLLPEDGGDGKSYTAVTLMFNSAVSKVRVRLSDLQAGGWGEGRTSKVMKLPQQWIGCLHQLLVASGKLYMISKAGYVLVLDLPSMSLSYIGLPDGVKYEYSVNLALSRAEGSGFFLIHVKGFQMYVWLCTTDSDSSCGGNWKLVDTICLQQVFGHLGGPAWQLQDTRIYVAAVGDSAASVFLRIQHEVYYMVISSRVVEKVYEQLPKPNFGSIDELYPLMLPWPPTFPLLNDGTLSG